MDLFKILSRGTKRTDNQPAAAVPNASPANPQLYHDPSRGVKRKRAEETPLERSNDENDDVDFFAPTQTNKPSSAEVTEETKAASSPVPSLLDEDEVRQILRSHRLKFTILSKNEKSKVKKSKSKQKEKAKAKQKDSPLFPQPLTSFNQLRSTYNVSPRLIENLSKQGYRTPTEIQLGSLPLLLRPDVALQGASNSEVGFETDTGLNFMGVGPTGSGKTLAFMIPTINAMMKRRAGSGEQAEHILEAIVLAPTKELGQQICNEGKKLAAGTGIKIVGFKKGMRIEGAHSDSDDDSASVSGEDSEDDDDAGSDGSGDEAQGEKTSSKKQPTTKADILVTTPMLLLNFLTKLTKSKRTLPTVRFLILDEGDALLDPLFRDQTLGIWGSCTNEALSLTCWSATMGSSIESLVKEQLASSNAHLSRKPLIRLVVGLKDSAVPSVNHRLIFTGDNERGKLFTLRQLLHPNTSSKVVSEMKLPFLVFVQSIDRAVSLHDELKFEFPAEAGGASRIASLHSSMSETARSGVIARFRAGEIWVLITTDLLMRGIDFRAVNGVINYDMPTSAAAYVHRVGRAGRAGREGGVAVTLYTKEDIPYLKSITNVIAISERQAGKDSDKVVPKWLMDALPKVRKEDKKNLKKHGVESRRGSKAQITSQSSWDRRKENNKQGAIAGSKKRRIEDRDADKDEDGKEESEWGGIDD